MPRHSRQRDEFPLLKLLMGLAIAANVAGLLGRVFARRRSRVRWSPIMLIFMAMAAFLAVAVLLSVLGGIVSLLGGAGAIMLFCLAPAAVLLLVVWAILQGQSRAAGAAGTAQPADSAQSAQTQEAVASQPAAQVAIPSTAQAPPKPAQQRAAAPPQQPAPRPIEAYPEKGARAPGDYRPRAASYRRRIQSLVKARRRGPLADRLADILPRLSSWEERVGQLADRVALFERDDLIRRDIKEVPQHIQRLRKQMPLEADPEVQRQMARTLAAYEEQYRQLEALAKLMRRTRLNLEDTLAAMGTIYSQVQVLNAMDIDSATAARIADEIDVEVNRLNDLLSALSEVNSGHAESYPAPVSDSGEEEAGLAGRKARLERRGAAE